MPKKLLNIIIILLVVTVSALLVYNFGLKKKPGKPTDETKPPAAGQPAITAPQPAPRIQVISQERVFWPRLSADGKKLIYFQTNGNLFESDFSGKEINKISSLALTNLLKVIWPATSQEKVIAIFNENGKTKKYFYDYKSGLSVALGDSIGWINWSPDAKKIVYQFRDFKTDKNTISISNPDGSGWQDIFKTRLENLIVEWPIKEKISLRAPVSGLSQGLLYTLNPANGDFQKILSDFYGLNIKWSPDAKRILFSTTNADGQNLTLFVGDELGQNRKDLKIATLIEKCLWSQDNRALFCAIPQKLSENAVWPDDYYKGKVPVSDEFYKISLETGTQTKLSEQFNEREIGYDTQFSYDAQNLLLSPKEDYLFFVNRRNGLLYQVRLF